MFELDKILSEESIHYNDFVLINSQQRQLNQDVIRNVINSEKRDISSNRIKVSVLKIIDELSNEDIKASNNADSKIKHKPIHGNSLEKLLERFYSIKNWLEINCKEFNHWFREINKEFYNHNFEKLSSECEVTNFKLTITGTQINISYQSAEKEKVVENHKEKSEIYFRKTVNKSEFIFDLLNIGSIGVEENHIKGLHGDNCYSVTFTCKEGLSKIKFNYFLKHSRFSLDEAGKIWQKGNEEGNSYEENIELLSLQSLNIEFLKAFQLKISELKNICEKIK